MAHLVVRHGGGFGVAAAARLAPAQSLVRER